MKWPSAWVLMVSVGCVTYLLGTGRLGADVLEDVLIFAFFIVLLLVLG